MSGWITFALVAVILFGRPDFDGTGRGAAGIATALYGTWAIVVIALLTAVLIDAKGWP